MLSLRALVAQSQESSYPSTKTKVEAESQESSSPPTKTKVEDHTSLQQNSRTNSNNRNNNAVTKRKRRKYTDDVAESDRKPAAKRIKVIIEEEGNDNSSESSAGEEWFGDNDKDEDDMAWHEDYNNIANGYSKALSAIYNTSSRAPGDLEAVKETLCRPQKSFQTVTFTPRIERLQPITRTVRHAGGLEEIITETVEEAKLRVMRNDRTLERNKMQKRWKNRNINYAAEKDIGNAFATRAKRLLEGKFRKEQQRIQQEVAANKAKEKETSEFVDDDASINEQHILLERLALNIKQEDTKEEVKGDLDLTMPYKEQMDFWEYGKSAPDKEDLDKYSYLYKDPRSLKAKTKIGTTEDTTDELKVPFSQFLHGTDIHKKQPEVCTPRYFFPPSFGDNESPSQYSHIRQLRVIAARSLCNLLGDEKTENRLMKSLFSNLTFGKNNRPVVDFDHHLAYRTLTYELGANIHFYMRHSWTDPQIVAQHLGLAGHPFGGVTVQSENIKQFFKSRRVFVKRKFMRGKRALSYEGAIGSGLNEGDDGDEVIDSSTPIKLDDKAAGKATLNPLTFDKVASRTVEVLVEGRQSEKIAPLSVFAHVPGTKAPIPPLPMETPGIIFGSEDRYAKFYGKAKVGDTGFWLVVSTLLSRVAKGRLSAELDGGDNTNATEAQLQQFVEDYVDIHHPKRAYLLAAKNRVADAPRVPLYRAVMSYCSLVASGCPMDQGNIISGMEYNDDDDLYSEEGDGVQNVAKKLSTLLMRQINTNGLLRFPRLRVVYALVKIACGIPKSAADILSKAANDSHLRTPIDIFKTTLEHMETNNMIKEKDYTEDDSVDVGNLEYLFFEAGKNLQHCIKLEALEVDYHMWYIGALACCLLLCSGNKIGAGAHLHPSERQHVAGSHINKVLYHEVRCKLPKFNEIRRALATAIKLLLELSKYQNGSRIHLAICSLLEWKEVIALFVGDSTQKDFADIRKFHSVHAALWLLIERPPNTPEISKRCGDCNELAFLADELENKPGDIKNWRKFVKNLGPVGIKERDNGTVDAFHNKETCPRCVFLRNGRMIDHDIEGKKNSERDWWGRNREWWFDSVLQLNSFPEPRRYFKNTEPVMQQLDKFIPVPSNYSSTFDNSTKYTKKEDLDTAWIPSDDVILEKGSRKTDEERSYSYDSELPQYLLENSEKTKLESNKNSNKMEFKLPELQGASAKQVELICYKILIFAHLNEYIWEVESFIHGLILGSVMHKKEVFPFGKWNTVKEDSNEFKALLWLCYAGLDIPIIARGHYHKSAKRALKKEFGIHFRSCLKKPIPPRIGGKLASNSISSGRAIAVLPVIPVITPNVSTQNTADLNID